MFLVAALIGTGVAAGTYWYANKQKKVSTGKSAAAAALTGATGYGVTTILIAGWPILLIGGAAAGIYYAYTKRGDQKALPPASE